MFPSASWPRAPSACGLVSNSTPFCLPFKALSFWTISLSKRTVLNRISHSVTWFVGYNFVWKLKLNTRLLWEVHFKQLRRLKRKCCVTCSDLEANFPSMSPHTPTLFCRQEANAEVMQLTGNAWSYHEFSRICRITPEACRNVILKETSTVYFPILYTSLYSHHLSTTNKLRI
jgi:hypothetical protein